MRIKIAKKVVRLRVYAVLVAALVVALVLMPKQTSGMPEIENKLLITTLGIDRTADGYSASAVVVMPQDARGGTVSKIEADSRGDSLADALERMSVKMGKPLELGLCGLVIIGDDFGSESVTPQLGYLLSSGKIIPGAYLVSATGGKTAKEVIELANKLSDATSNVLGKLIEYNATSSNVPAVSLLRFLGESNRRGGASFMPCLEIGESENEAQKGDSSGGGESSGGSGSDTGTGKKSEIKSLGRIAFFRDGVKITEASEEITRGYTWSDGRSTLGLVTLKDFTVGGENCGDVYCRLLDKKYALKTEIKGSPKATMDVKVKLALEERSRLGELIRKNATTEKEIDERLREEVERKITGEILAAVEYTRSIGCDAFGFEDDAYRTAYRDYASHENAERIFQEIQPRVRVKITVE